MSNLAMSVPGLPAGLRLTQLSRDHAADLTDLVRAKELTFFQRSETNTKEILGTLSAPELDGTRGTAGVWDDGRLLAAMLAFNGLQHERGCTWICSSVRTPPTAAVLRPHCSPPGSGTDKPCRRPMTPI